MSDNETVVKTIRLPKRLAIDIDSLLEEINKDAYFKTTFSLYAGKLIERGFNADLITRHAKTPNVMSIALTKEQIDVLSKLGCLNNANALELAMSAMHCGIAYMCSGVAPEMSPDFKTLAGEKEQKNRP